MNHYEKLISNLNKERDEFQKTYNNMDKLQIYNDWYIIGFFEAYHEMLTSDFFEFYGGEDLCLWLSNFENPLHFLYDEWLSCDGAFDHDWDMMLDFVKNLKKECM